MGIVFWFTGLSGSGKTTLAKAFAMALEEHGKSVCIIDGDDVRSKRARPLGFSREDICENNRLIAEYAKEKSGDCDMILVPIISPYREDRGMARTIVGEHFFEVFIDCSLSVCEARDVKGLYKKARSGAIKDFIGISESNPYEKPLNPHITIETGTMSIDEGIKVFLDNLRARGHI